MDNTKLSDMLEKEGLAENLNDISDEELEGKLSSQGIDVDELMKQEPLKEMSDLEEPEVKEEELGEKETKAVAGGWWSTVRMGCYHVPCNVCGTWFTGYTYHDAQVRLFLHCNSRSHKSMLKCNGYGYYNNKPYYG